MNIETLQDHINCFMQEVMESGFKRDVDDYTSSISSAQNNILALRDISGKVLTVLDKIYNGDLPDSMKALFPTQGSKPFTDEPYDDKIRALAENKEIQQQDYFNQLNQLLNQLKKQLQQNLGEVTKIRDFIAPYLSAETKINAKDGTATLSIVFKEQKTTSSLTLLTKTLSAWNRTLPVYHQLIKSESPQDIHVVEVQNGSIDLIINLNADVALNLAELFKIGFHCYVAYLSYKSLIKPISDNYYGNKKLIDGEKDRETDLLKNIYEAVYSEVIKQHKAAKKEDKAIHGTSIEVKAKEVTSLVTSHIIRGNDIKLLAIPESKTGEENGNPTEDLRSSSSTARSKLRVLPAKEKQKLLDLYGKLPDETKE